ncbi:hypothetical protein EYR38_003158 [Pleurotus pulmonarius]|nr:hypothetical protein EYR38_003158 [Pleurotus pulmonarius]
MAPSNDEAVNNDDEWQDEPVALPQIPTLQRGWAKGSRKAFLEERLPRFKTAALAGRSKKTEAITAIVNEYFKIYSWRLPVTEEPTSTPPPEQSNDLTTEEKRVKGEVIKRMTASIRSWMDYRATKLTTALQRINTKSTSDPFALLLSQFTGISSKPPKLRTGWQVFEHEKYIPEMKETFDAQFGASGLPEGKRASERNKYVIDRFKALPPEVQEAYTQQGVDQHNASKEAINAQAEAELELSPSERQALIERIGEFFGPLLTQVSELLKMHISLLVGGPEPKHGGDLNVLSLHIGTNLAPIPQRWDVAHPTEFQTVVDTFLEFLRTCYTPSDYQKASLPPEELAQYCSTQKDHRSENDAANGPADDSANQPKPAYVQSKPTPSGKRGRSHSKSKPGRRDNESDPDTSEPESDREEIRRRKKTRSQKSRLDKSKPKTNREDIRRRAHPKKSRPDPRQHLRPRKALSGKRFSSRHPGQVQISKGRWVDLAAPKLGPPRGVKRASVTAGSDDGDEPEAKRQASIDSIGLPSPSSAANPSSDPRSTPLLEQIISTSTSTLAPAHPLDDPTTPLDPSSANNTGTDGTLARKPDQALVFPALDPAWPDWLSKTYKLLTKGGDALGTPWYHLLDIFTRFESSSDVTRDIAFSASNRPPQVGLWIQNARERTPAIPDLAIFEHQWWAWWRALQPPWRAYSTTTGPISVNDLLPIPTDSVAGSESFTALDRAGRNGLLSVVSSLRWWGDAIRSLVPRDCNWLDDKAAESWKLGIADVNRMVILVWLAKMDTETRCTYLAKLTYDAHGSTIIL